MVVYDEYVVSVSNFCFLFFLFVCILPRLYLCFGVCLIVCCCFFFVFVRLNVCFTVCFRWFFTVLFPCLVVFVSARSYVCLFACMYVCFVCLCLLVLRPFGCLLVVFPCLLLCLFVCFVVVCWVPGRLQWMPDPPVLSQGAQGLRYRHVAEWRVSSPHNAPAGPSEPDQSQAWIMLKLCCRFILGISKDSRIKEPPC